MKLLISAAETSSDVHGAELLLALRALRARSEDPEVDAFGVGGPRLQAAGLRPVVDARELLAMGFSEILGRLPRIFRALRELSEVAQRERPDVAVVIDYPDFHFRLARRLRKLGIPVVYYIPPKVWAWRKSRVQTLRAVFSRILCILPFEEEFYRRENVPVKYVGNPLIDELPFTLTRAQARRGLGLEEASKVLLLMPGSRPSEVKRHFEFMLDAALAAALRLRDSGYLGAGERLEVLLPFPETADMGEVGRRVTHWEARVKPGADFPLRLRVSQGNAHAGMVAADGGLVKSGTSTLEAGLLACPHAVVYRPNALTCFIVRRLIRYRGPAGLVNLVADFEGKGPTLTKEFICRDATLEALTAEVVALLTDHGRRERLFEGFQGLRRKVMGSLAGAPSQVAAQEVLQVAERHRAGGAAGSLVP